MQHTDEAIVVWTDEDVAFKNGLAGTSWTDESIKATNIGTQEQQQRLFCAYIEDWVRGAIKTNDCVAEAKILRKYKDLRWLDPDTNNMYIALPDNLEWHPRMGWCIIGVDENNESEP